MGTVHRYVGNMGQLAPVVMSAMESTPWIVGIDYYRLGSYKPDEILQGHGSPYLGTLWANIMFNMLLPAQAHASCAQQLQAAES